MRLYSFTNMYTSGIHAGIQTAHLVHELFSYYTYEDETAKNALYEWASDHKTIIVLNGGYHSDLKSIREQVGTLAIKLGLPWGSFSESAEALNGAMTAVGIVVPERIYNHDIFLSSMPEFERELYDLIKSYPLAK